MAKLKLKVAKSGAKNPQTKKMGYVARVITNGTADYDDIVEEACHNTTVHKAEAKVALELCMESVAAMLKQGYIVDLGPVGKLYPSCSSGWVENADELQLGDIKPTFYFHATDDLTAAIKGATLQWVKDSEAAADGDDGDDGDGDGGGGVMPPPAGGGD